MRSWEEVESLKRLVEGKLDEIDSIPGAQERVGQHYNYLCNVTETLSWIFEEIPTEDFVSSEHLGLKDLDALIGEAPKEETSDTREFASLKVPLGEMIRFLGNNTETIDRLRLIFPRMEQLRIIFHGGKQREALEGIISEMKELRKKTLNLQSQQRRLAKEMEEVRHRVSLEVFTAVDERGKRKYSNEDMRNAALHVELAANPHYRELDDEAYSIQRQRDLLLTEYETLAQTRDIVAILGASENSN